MFTYNAIHRYKMKIVCDECGKTVEGESTDEGGCLDHPFKHDFYLDNIQFRVDLVSKGNRKLTEYLSFCTVECLVNYINHSGKQFAEAMMRE